MDSNIPADHKCVIWQGFAASLLLTPLFFSGFLVEFFGSNEEGTRGKTLYRGGTLSSGGEATSPPAPRPPPGTCLQVWKNKF